MIKKIALIGIIILFTLLLIYCTTDESTIIGPFGDASKYISVANFSADKTLLYSNGDTTLISIKVLDVDKTPAIGLKVDFSAQFGKITESDTTDSNGIALATFVSDENTGENIITADTGVKTYTLPITVVKYQPKYLVLSAKSPVLLADGESKTKITAVLKDSTGSPMAGMTVNFHTTLGSLSSPIEITDEDGTASSELTSSDTIGTATITATSGIESTIDVKFHLDVPAIIELSAGNPVLLADGISTTTITAIVKDSLGHRMDNETVRFTTTSGTLLEELVVTENGGVAKTELTSSTTPGTALIIATSFVSDSVEVEFNINVPSTIDMSASPTVILADGQAISIITAIPKDEFGNPMPGLTVLFSTTLGTLSETIKVTDTDGIATTNLISGTTAGAAIVTATSSAESTIGVQFIAYNPAYIVLSLEGGSEGSILADGKSEINIIAKVYNSANQIIPWALVDFSTTYGSLNKTTVRANELGEAIVTLTSAGSAWSYSAEVTAEVQGTSSISENIFVKFRGISITTNVDSVQFASGGNYKVYIRSHLFDVELGEDIENATVAFSSTIGLMDPEADWTDEFGRAFSILSAEVTGVDQSGLIIKTKLWFAPNEVIDSTESMVIPGVEALISTVDDEVMGDGVGYALVKATLREITGKAITETEIDWETTLGTIQGKSTTNTIGHTIDTLAIEAGVSANTNVTITANYGDNISISDIVTFIPPIGQNRLILGFEPDITAHGIIPCDTDTTLALRDVGISAQFVDSGSGGIGFQRVDFSVVPNNFASICPFDTTSSNGAAIVMMVYPPQNAGQIVRVWAQADGTRGSIDVILPKDEEEDDDSGGG